MLEAARRSPLAELRQQCARTKAAGGVDAEARRRRIHQRRSLRSFTDAEGEWHLHCRNNPEVGARIMAALDPFREAVFRQARSEGRHEPPEAYSADALTEMARQSCGGGARAEPPTVAAAREPGSRGTDGATPESRPAEAGGTTPESGAAEAGGTTRVGSTVESADTVEAGGPDAAGSTAEAGSTADAGVVNGSAFVAGEPGASSVDARAEIVVGPHSKGSGARRPARGGGGSKVIVRVDLGVLLRGYAIEGEVWEIAGFGPVAASAVRDMIDTDDPFLTAVVTKGQKLLGVAHLGRRPNALQQTACSGSTRAAPTRPAAPKPVSTTTTASTGPAPTSPCWTCSIVSVRTATPSRPDRTGPWSRAGANGPSSHPRMAVIPGTPPPWSRG